MFPRSKSSRPQWIRPKWPSTWPLQPIPAQRWSEQRPTWQDADPSLIDAALQRAQARPSGNWFVFAASRDVLQDRPFSTTVAGQELVAWRGPARWLYVAPGACPHLGGPLAQARVECGRLICRWHGLSLGPEGRFGWNPLPAYDDGVLAWVRLDSVGDEPPLPEPVLPQRPPVSGSIDTVTMVVGRCEPEDVVANRLDPWHGAWFHPYSFAHLKVLNPEISDRTDHEGQDRFVVRVTFRVAPSLGVRVRAEFTCPDPRTVVMRILEGEGAGSVVETHATPLGTDDMGAPRTAVIEATIANSDRRGFAWARSVTPALRPVMRWAAERLWRDDLAYAERRYRLRAAGRWPR